MLYLYWLVVPFELMKAWCHQFEEARDNLDRGIAVPIAQKPRDPRTRR